MKLLFPLFAGLLLLAGCAHLPQKASPESGLVIIPIEARNASGAEFVVTPYLWFSDSDVIKAKVDKGTTAGPDSGYQGDNVLNAGRHLVRVVSGKTTLNTVLIWPKYSPDGKPKVRSQRINRSIDYIPGGVVVADFKFVMTQTKHDGSYYNYDWKLVDLSADEKEAILAGYRNDKANAAWFE